VVVKPDDDFLMNNELVDRINILCKYYVPLSPSEIVNAIRKLNVNNSNGLSQIPPKIVKLFADDLSPILTDIYNHCVFQGEFPSKWKTALVTALLKSGQNCLDPNSSRLFRSSFFKKSF
jgi:hypothetical protein